MKSNTMAKGSSSSGVSSPLPPDRRSSLSPATLLIVSAAGAAIFTRLLLLVFPEAGGSPVLGVHIHHLLIGILLICLGGIPAVLLRSAGPMRSLAVAAFGAGIGLALDEWLLFVLRESAPATPYMDSWSVTGAAILVGLVVVYTLAISGYAAARSGSSQARHGAR